MAMPIPATLLDLCDRFPSEEACWEYLRRLRWPHGLPLPALPGDGRIYRDARAGSEQCRRCRHQASVTAGTVFHGTRIPLRTWFLAIFFVARHKQGISALQLQRDTGLGQLPDGLDAAAQAALGARARRPGQLLRGIVEADETYPGSPRHGASAVAGARRTRPCVAAVVERRKQAPAPRTSPSCWMGQFDTTWPLRPRRDRRGRRHRRARTVLRLRPIAPARASGMSRHIQ